MKRILTFIICALLLPVVQLPAKAATKDAYTNIQFVDADSYYPQEGTAKPRFGDWIGNTQAGAGLKFEDIDFGEKSPREIYIDMALDPAYSGSMKIFADDVEIGTVNTTSTGSWTTFEERKFILDENTLTGVHDIEFKFSTTPVAELKTFRFGDEGWITAETPELGLKNRNMGNVTSFERAIKLTATAQLAMSRGSTPSAMLLLVQYDSNGFMKALDKEVKLPATDGSQTTFELGINPQISKRSGVTSAGVYFWLEDMTVLTNGVHSHGYTQGTAVADDVSVTYNSSVVTIAGTSSKDTAIPIALFDKNASTADITNAKHLFEIPVENGKFSYSFTMSDAMPNGDYKIVLKKDGQITQEEFSYRKLSEIYDVLNTLDNSANGAAAIATLSAEHKLFGIEYDLFDGMPVYDANYINEQIQACFAQNPLSVSSDYSLWINAISDAIIPQAVMGSLKNSNTDAADIADVIMKNKTLLGIAGSSKLANFIDSNKENIVKLMKKNVADDALADALLELFENAVIIERFNSADAWGYVDEALLEYHTDLSIDVSLYKKLENSAKQQLCSEMMNSDYSDITKLAGDFVALIAKYGTDENIKYSSFERIPLDEEKTVFSYEIFVPEQEETAESIKMKFTDLNTVVWAKDSIQKMYELGYINGMSDTEFAPLSNITREEFAAIIVRAFGFTAQNSDGITFLDVDKSAWYAQSLAAAYENGIINGRSSEWFGVGDNITREDITVMLSRAVKKSGKNFTLKAKEQAFADFAEISDYAYSAVIELGRAEIINGTGNRRFSPKKNATRAEAAVMFARLLDNIR